MRILSLDRPETIKFELERIGVDNGAFNIFFDKSQSIVIKLYDLTCAQANVLKQLALSHGGDCAIHRDVIKGEKKISNAILFINRRQMEIILKKMTEQGFLDQPLRQLRNGLERFDGTSSLKFKNTMLPMDRTYLMGVLNVTTDSFYEGSRFCDPAAAVDAAEKMVEAGVDFIDVGAESTRPGSNGVEAKEEIGRLEPVLKKLLEKIKLPISVDTYKAEVARVALAMGVSIINDISAYGFDEEMINVMAQSDAGLVLMHIKGRPANMQDKPEYEDLMEELYGYFTDKIETAERRGIDRKRIIIDPGLGFGKKLEDNYAIMRRLSEFKIFNRPILVGPSRKSFVGVPFGLPAEERLEGTLGLLSLLIWQGANIVRVHDVPQTKRVCQLTDLILK